MAATVRIWFPKAASKLRVGVADAVTRVASTLPPKIAQSGVPRSIGCGVTEVAGVGEEFGHSDRTGIDSLRLDADGGLANLVAQALDPLRTKASAVSQIP